MRKIDRLLNEYGESHKNSTNKLIHWICVPLIFWSIVALLFAIPTNALETVFNDSNELLIFLNWAAVALIFLSVYYFLLSFPLAIGMIVFGVACIFVCNILSENFSFPLWGTALIVFVLAWIGQFIGHNIEGKKPSFLKDLQFLLIGPAWLMHFILKKLNINY